MEDHPIWLVAFEASLCMQAVSMVSVFVGGVVNAVIPIASSLYGQRDFSGMKILMQTAARVQFVINLLVLVIFELWPQGILAMYNVLGDVVPLAETGLRIFSVMFLFRGVIFLGKSNCIRICPGGRSCFLESSIFYHVTYRVKCNIQLKSRSESSR